MVINCAINLLNKREPIVEFELESELGEEPHEELPERWALEDVMTKLTKEEKDIILLDSIMIIHCLRWLRYCSLN